MSVVIIDRWSSLCAPVESLWGDSAEAVALLPPGAPAGVLETDTVGDFVLLAGHVAPGAPDVLLFPVVGEVVDLAAGEGGDGRVVGDGVGGDANEEDGEIVCHR